MFLAFVHGFAGVTVINISYLLPAAVLIHGYWVSWFLTVGVGLGLRCWILADIRPSNLCPDGDKCLGHSKLSLVTRKPVFGVCDQV